MLLQIDKRECRTIMNLLSGFFPVRDHRIHVYHKSITDWLLDQAYQGSERISNESIYVIDVEKVQERIFQRCFDLIDNNNILLTKDYLEHKQGLKYAIKYVIHHCLYLNKLPEARQVLLRHDWIIVRALVGESYNMYQDYCNYLSQLPHHNIQVRAFPDEWSVHDLVTHLPAAGHHDYDAQHPDYSNYMPH